MERQVGLATPHQISVQYAKPRLVDMNLRKPLGKEVISAFDKTAGRKELRLTKVDLKIGIIICVYNIKILWEDSANYVYIMIMTLHCKHYNICVYIFSITT